MRRRPMLPEDLREGSHCSDRPVEGARRRCTSPSTRSSRGRCIPRHAGPHGRRCDALMAREVLAALRRPARAPPPRQARRSMASRRSRLLVPVSFSKAGDASRPQDAFSSSCSSPMTRMAHVPLSSVTSTTDCDRRRRARSLFELQAAVDAEEQKRFERASRQADRFIEDRLAGPSAGGAARLLERLEQARARRDGATGSEARTEAERALLSIETQLAELDGPIGQLENRDDDTFQRYLSSTSSGAATRPRVSSACSTWTWNSNERIRQRDDIMLKLVHTADWHLGRTVPQLPGGRGAQARPRAPGGARPHLADLADRHAADAVLCAGDLFDEPDPGRLVGARPRRRCAKAGSARPVFLLPGNHDPLTSDSVWTKEPSSAACFRTGSTSSIATTSAHLPQRRRALCGAVPIESRPARSDRHASRSRARRRAHPHRHGPRQHLRRRGLADELSDPSPTPLFERGLDYLAIGDTHGFRFVPPDRTVPPTIYPGAPEPTAFDEQEPGHVAVVFINRRRVATVRPERVAQVDVGGGAGHLASPSCAHSRVVATWPTASCA